MLTNSVGGPTIVPQNRPAGAWQTDKNTRVLSQSKEMIQTRLANFNWGVIAWAIPGRALSGRIDVSGEYIGGLSGKYVNGMGGNPGLRVYAGSTLEWRKRGHEGLTSNGGRGDGFGAPIPLPGTLRVNLSSFRQMRPLLTIIFTKKGGSYEVMAKFDGWTQFHPINYVPGNKIILSSKGFSLVIKTSDIKISETL